MREEKKELEYYMVQINPTLYSIMKKDKELGREKKARNMVTWKKKHFNKKYGTNNLIPLYI